MNPFWRKNPLTRDEQELLDAVAEAHYRSAFRSNPSSIVAGCAAQGSGDLTKALAASMMTIGGPHGPIIETYELLNRQRFLSSPVDCTVEEYLSTGRRLPGWGNSFIRDQIDPLWQIVDGTLKAHFEDYHEYLCEFTDALHKRGKRIYPNPSAFTAAAALIVEMPQRLAPYLFISGRLQAWTEIFLNESKGT